MAAAGDQPLAQNVRKAYEPAADRSLTDSKRENAGSLSEAAGDSSQRTGEQADAGGDKQEAHRAMELLVAHPSKQRETPDSS